MSSYIPFPNIAPEIFTISLFGMEFALRWYALAYIIGILFGWMLALRALKTPGLWPRDTAPMNPKQVEDMLTWIILGVIFGGRLGYVLFYQHDGYYRTNPAEIFALWQGGMAFHGGMLGVVIAAWIYAWRQKLPKLSTADSIVLGVPPGLLLGRIANFINAELWGRPTDMPWGVAFPGEAAQTCAGVIDICARHPSQLYEALLEGLILGAVLIWMVWRRGALKRPGTVAGVFFVGYGLSRFVVEFVRQPDAQFITQGNPLGLAWHVGGYGLTMGQILSVPMIAVGLWLIRQARAKAA